MCLFSRFRVAFLLAFGMFLIPAAHADVDDADFKMHVLDPPGEVPGTPHYITGLTFDITFTACLANELPGGMTADGCFLGFNRSADDWTSLQFLFQNNAALHAQAPDCSGAPSNNLFQQTRCVFDSQSSQYVLDFSSGVISNTGSGSAFFITEDGVIPPTDFGTGSATVTSYTPGVSNTVSPEPSTWVLLGSGVLLLGVVKINRFA